MPTLQIGQTVIPYELRRSATASERRITVTPGHVEVLALDADDDETVAGFLKGRRQWLFNTVREIERATANRHAVPRFMTGSKIPYRGRKVPLIVRRTDAERFSITYRNGLIVDLPVWAGENADALIASELKLWLKHRARRDVMESAKGHAARIGERPHSIRVGEFSKGWGSCGAAGNILINWHLIFAPRKVLDYVVAHEIAHLRHRSHDLVFWHFLESFFPDYRRSKAWLDQHEHSLSAGFLTEPESC